MFIMLWSRKFCLEIQLTLLFRSSLWYCFRNSSICSPPYHQRMMHNQSKSFLDESGEQLVSQLLIFYALKSIVSSILGHQEGMISRSSLALKTCFYTFTSSEQMRNWLKKWFGGCFGCSGASCSFQVKDCSAPDSHLAVYEVSFPTSTYYILHNYCILAPTASEQSNTSFQIPKKSLQILKKWQILEFWLSLKRLHNFTIETEDLMTKDLAIQRSPCKAKEQRSLVSAFDTKIYSRPGNYIHWNEIWTKNESRASWGTSWWYTVYSPLKRLDAILNIQIWCHTMYLQCAKSFSPNPSATNQASLAMSSFKGL